MLRYDIDHESYARASWIDAGGNALAAPRPVIRFHSNRSPFDTLLLAVVDPWTLVTIDREELPFEKADFVYVRRSPDLPDATVREIEAID